ncbi:2-oxoglutarate dehydrogenase E1 component [Acidisarcina polymorpha]|uniref:oxoglutarate dehydrogenase (succinyl-transferring) n=1 Tax=Acidisarcina polymorpha TaxID=2211140 RepID=A0A2Z5G2Y8_9BACT|nr:2-oxoglutarate dehydrogenase E1 component [Acidisarcina polymorpha]AXC13390.1 2-oxoglutarate dehydrogenase E1 component [Acidisarcina polymorpha]
MATITTPEAPTSSPVNKPNSVQASRAQVFDAFRRWGYLQAQLDPLGQYLPPKTIPDLDLTGPDADEARGYYCGTVAAEFMHIADAGRREWIQERLENRANSRKELQIQDQNRTLELLLRADLFEQVIQSRYLGTKRFSLEGVTVLVPFIDELLHHAAEHGAVSGVIGMSHRGRLNVMVNVIGCEAADIFSKFEDVDPRSILGGGDVKYHVGATGDYVTRGGKTVDLHLVSNPSHLEAVDPVAAGRARAKQFRFGQGGEDKLIPIVIHGDAAFAGQGVLAETMNLATIDGFSIGGTIHIVVNNLIGFTAGPDEVSSSRFATDVAKRLPIPIFHVNAEDPDAVLRIAALAAEYRFTFHNDVVIDLIGYRRHGHSEVDDPTITQPIRYAKIKDHPPLYQIYSKAIGADISARTKELQTELVEAQKEATIRKKMPVLSHLPEYWSPFHGGSYKPEYDVETGLTTAEIAKISEGLTAYPADFHIHPKIKKLLEQRLEMGHGERPFDYGMAEAVAIGSLLKQGTPVRLSGQDSQRGTFNQRHSVLVDIENEQHFIPLNHLAPDQRQFEVYNSILSEAGVLGFEYGFSRDYPEALVMWEAQFGDFANGAQIIIDQFISSGEDKWGLLSGVVMLLPHGYEGQGPEHSSARVERYLQLAAHDNMQICQPSTAAQYFHLLRRQVMRPWRKPLVVFTPKSMLRNPSAASPIADFSRPHFLNVVPDTEAQNAKRLLLCTGKIGHELRIERQKRGVEKTAIVLVDQLYPWPEADLEAEFERHPEAHEIVWVQEEPANMGALSFVMPRLRLIAGSRQVLSVKRSAAASPATGSAKAHRDLEQRR